MGDGLLPGRKPGRQHTGDLIPGRAAWEDATEPRMPSLRHQAVPGRCPGAQAGDSDGGRTCSRSFGRQSCREGEQLHTVRKSEQEMDRLFARAEQPQGPF